MEDKEIYQVLEQAKSYNELSLSEKTKIEQARRKKVLEERVKKVVSNAAKLNHYTKTRTYIDIQNYLVVMGIMLAAISISLFSVYETCGFVAVSLLLAAKLIAARISNSEVKKLLRNQNLAMFTKIFLTATEVKKGTKWLKASEICEILAAKGYKTKAKDMGTQLTKVCLKIHRKYLVICL